MRTLNATLQAAMDSGNFTPIVRAALLDKDDHSVIEYLDLVYFKINGIEIEIEFYCESGSMPDSVSLERGAKIGGVDYTIFSGIYMLSAGYKMHGGAKGHYACRGVLVDQIAVDVAGDGSYEMVINAVMAEVTGMTASFKNPAATWLGYQFLSQGQHYLSNNVLSFFTLLKQKYFVFVTENGLDSLLFFSVSDALSIAAEYTIHLTDVDTFSMHIENRQFVWKDENGTIHYPGPSGYPIHNLGYLETTDNPPNIPSNADYVSETVATIIPNLKYQSGDCVKFDPGIDGFTAYKSVMDVTEIFDARGGNKKKPAWYMELRPLEYFNTTAGGYLPPASVYTSAYSMLATNGFVGVLNSSVNNVQALADAVDQYSGVQYSPDAPTVQIAGKEFVWCSDEGRLYIWSNSAWHVIGELTGSGTAGRLAEFSATKTLQASKIVGPTTNVLTIYNNAAASLWFDIASGKALTIAAADNYSFTVPATGTAALLGVANVFTINQTITGSTDAVQLKVKGNATQTANLQEWQNSSGSVLAGINGTGQLGVGLAPQSYRGISVLFQPVTTDTDKAGQNLEIKFGDGITGNMANWVYGLRFSAQINTAYTGNITGALASLRGVVNNYGTGNRSDVRGLSSQIVNREASTMSIVKVLHADETLNLSTGTITNLYGLYIENQAVGSNNYAIYTNSGLVRIGDQVTITGNADRQQLAVNGYSTQAVATSLAAFNRTDTASGISAMFTLQTVGSGAAGDGGVINLRGKSSTTTAQLMGTLSWFWNVATHASAVADVTISAGYNSGSSIVAKEFLRGRGGSSPFVGVNCTLSAGGVTYRTLNVHGSALLLGTDSSAESPIFEIIPAYVSNTHSDYTTRTVFNAYTAAGGAYEVMRLEGITEARIGFLGHVAAVQQTGCAVPTDLASAIAAITALRTALNAYGLTTVV